MDLATLETQVRGLLLAARDSLARIEQEVRETVEDPRLMAASREYAQLCMHLREFLSTIQMHKPMPRRLAQHARERCAGLAPLAHVLEERRLHPSPDEVEALAAAAESLPERM